MKRLFQAGPEAKRGVALIVVLGFLSLMIMMAVTFLILWVGAPVLFALALHEG